MKHGATQSLGQIGLTPTAMVYNSVVPRNQYSVVGSWPKSKPSVDIRERQLTRETKTWDRKCRH